MSSKSVIKKLIFFNITRDFFSLHVWGVLALLPNNSCKIKFYVFFLLKKYHFVLTNCGEQVYYFLAM